MRSLATCEAPPHLQQASFLPGSVQPRDTWPYPWHLKHRATSTCSRMRQFTHPTLSLPSPSKLRASASVKRTTAVCTPPKRLYSLHWSPRSGLPSAMHNAATTSSAFSPTAFFAFSKVETTPPFSRTRRISYLLVLRMERTSAPAFWGFTFAFTAFRISA